MELKKELVLRDIAGDFVLIPTGTTVLENNGLFTINEVAAQPAGHGHGEAVLAAHPMEVGGKQAQISTEHTPQHRQHHLSAVGVAAEDQVDAPSAGGLPQCKAVRAVGEHQCEPLCILKIGQEPADLRVHPVRIAGVAVVQGEGIIVEPS